MELLDFSPKQIRLRIVCSKGTYIRALARDIGEALHSGAHLIALRRTQVGNFTVQQAYTLPAFEEWLSQQSIETDLD